MASGLKERAVEFLRLAAAGDVCRAFELHASTGLRHHNPYFAADAASLMQGMLDNASQMPDKALEVLRVLHEGDLVAVHSRMCPAPGARCVALVHLFRFEQGRIAELWDVAQPEPEQSPNANGMF